MIAPRKEMMIILNGHHKSLVRLVSIFIISFVFCSNAEEIKVAPLINLDEIEPSYDEELILNNIESQSTESKKKNGDINDDKATSMAEISILNKITTNVDTVKLPLKENYFYQELKIYPIDCHLSGLYEKSEVGIYLNIHDKDTKEKIFNGWMLKSLPSISSMEHPIYDIWVEDCF